MTDFHPSVEREFDAGHDRIDLLDTCRHDGHGHRWRVRVTVQGAFDPRAGRSYRMDELGRDLDMLVTELAGKSLNKMLPGTIPTPEGLGLWVIEKLVSDHPKIVEVIVWLDRQHRYSLSREPR